MLAHPLGVVLLSQDPAVQVPSALEDLTVVFGMGTCGTPPPSTPNGYYAADNHEAAQGAYSTSNLEPALEVRCSFRVNLNSATPSSIQFNLLGADRPYLL